MIGRLQGWFGNGWVGIAELLITAFCVFLSLSIHEFSHGFAAYKFGDDTAKRMGRLNINPLSHLDPVGALCLFFFGFGWAKPVPVNPLNLPYGKRKSRMALISFAGPLSNLLTAFLAVVFLHLIYALLPLISGIGITVFSVVETLLYTLIYINVGLAVFNFIPVPPLDGSKILNAVLPPRIYFKIMEFEQYGFIILLLIINIPFFTRLLYAISNLIISVFFWLVELVPFF
jgi:Zn-dependent protease